MNGAESLVRTLVASGVDVCFTNPGTSEMHFVAALDRVDGMRCVLGLFEGVVTGMADGYGRMADKPASTLLHLGPGLGNGLANLHNAKKAFTPVVNIVGEHATYHIEYDAPLTADIEGIARPVSGWVKTSRSAKDVAGDGAAAVAASMGPPGQIATLILPANTAWDESNGPVAAIARAALPGPDPDAVRAAAKALTAGGKALLHMSGRSLRADTLEIAGRIAAKTGCRLSCQTSNGRWQRGAGRVSIERIQYPVDIALKQLASVEQLVLLGTKVPVAFFAYPNKPSLLTPEGCAVHTLAEIGDDHLAVLTALCDELDAWNAKPVLQKAERPELATGALTPEAVAAALGRLMPENAIIADESVTSGRGFMPFTAGSAPHDWLALTGGSIGLGLPYATGAAIACPDRKVICTEGDGSGMYTLQALWTQAREGCDVVNIIFANRSYAILRHELTNVGAQNPGRKAIDMLTLDRPELDWVALGKGMGVAGVRVDTAEAFNDALARAIAEPGPHLIEAWMA
ncbi:acetolactate synthase large subunit [Thalassobaculum sp.]|uniref:acetolactate synthase large subunit n=1 Tax=Thalassobaculum sp. TaxID=2022740 RepID=UPI0032ED7161